MTSSTIQSLMVVLCFGIAAATSLAASVASYILFRAMQITAPEDRWFIRGFVWASLCVLGNLLVWVVLLRPHAKPAAPGSIEWTVLALLFLTSKIGLMVSGVYLYLGLRRDGSHIRGVGR